MTLSLGDRAMRALLTSAAARIIREADGRTCGTCRHAFLNIDGSNGTCGREGIYSPLTGNAIELLRGARAVACSAYEAQP